LFSIIKVFLRRANWFSWSSNFFILLCKSSYSTLWVPELCSYMNIHQHNNLRIIIAGISLMLKFTSKCTTLVKCFLFLYLAAELQRRESIIHCHSINVMLIYNVTL
jgi:hypothetical protein